ncbi:MAG: hypothetical protein PHR78_07580 [Eubacteriales bacterium]|nr:hypothetical protein [Eubacteriales bacterium]
MFSQYEATSTSSDLFRLNCNELLDLVRTIPGLESAGLNQGGISCLSSPQGLAVELTIPQEDYLLCLYDIRDLEQAKLAWDFAFYSSVLVDGIFKRTHCWDSVLRSACFAHIGRYSYVLLPLTKGQSLSDKLQQETYLQVLSDFILLSSLPVSLKREARFSFVEAGRDKDTFFREVTNQYRRADDGGFTDHKELKGMSAFIKECKINLLRSKYLRNTMQLSPYTQTGILRLKDNLLHLCKPLCLEYSIIDLNLCDFLSMFRSGNGTKKSLLVHIYYNLQVPLQFFNLYALDSFTRILQNWKLPYSDYQFNNTLESLIKYKTVYRNFESCIPQWYQEPIVRPQVQYRDSKSYVTFLYLREYIKEIML